MWASNTIQRNILSSPYEHQGMGKTRYHFTRYDLLILAVCLLLDNLRISCLVYDWNPLAWLVVDYCSFRGYIFQSIESQAHEERGQGLVLVSLRLLRL